MPSELILNDFILLFLFSGAYSVMSHQILSKERDIQCSLRADISDKFNFISLFIAIGVPLVMGPIFCPIAHSFLTILACCKGVNVSTCDPSDKKSTGVSVFLRIFFPKLLTCSYYTQWPNQDADQSNPSQKMIPPSLLSPLRSWLSNR